MPTSINELDKFIANKVPIQKFDTLFKFQVNLGLPLVLNINNFYN